MNGHHKLAFALLGVTAVGIAVLGTLLGLTEHCGAWHGMYCSTGLATTDGCDLALHGWKAYTLAELSMILMIPLWTTVFSFVTAGILAIHIDAKTDKQTEQLKEHLSS